MYLQVHTYSIYYASIINKNIKERNMAFQFRIKDDGTHQELYLCSVRINQSLAGRWRLIMPLTHEQLKYFTRLACLLRPWRNGVAGNLSLTTLSPQVEYYQTRAITVLPFAKHEMVIFCENITHTSTPAHYNIMSCTDRKN